MDRTHRVHLWVLVWKLSHKILMSPPIAIAVYIDS